jgi:hypothetical protein
MFENFSRARSSTAKRRYDILFYFVLHVGCCDRRNASEQVHFCYLGISKVASGMPRLCFLVPYLYIRHTILTFMNPAAYNWTLKHKKTIFLKIIVTI